MITIMKNNIHPMMYVLKKMSISQFGTLYVVNNLLASTSSSKIAGFDVDNTLVMSVRAIKYFKDADDWRLLPYRVEVLLQYQTAGYQIVLFTNQGDNRRREVAVQRIQNISNRLRELGVSHLTLIATGRDHYRKPQIGMWEAASSLLNITIDRANSLFVGDAAGRLDDFSDSDKLFANNYGVPFFVPEDFFPRDTLQLASGGAALLIFAGIPGSGKTTYYQWLANNREWVHANQDQLGTKAKVLKTVKDALALGKSVVVDRTNPSAADRAEFIDLARQYHIPTAIVYFIGNGYARNQRRGQSNTEKKVPDITYHRYYKVLEEPTLELDGVPVLTLYQ